MGCIEVQDHGGLTDAGRDAGSDRADASEVPQDAATPDAFLPGTDAALSPVPVAITVNTQAILEEGWQYVGITPWAAETIAGTEVPVVREGDCVRLNGALPTGYVEGRFADTALSWWSATLDGSALPLTATAASVTTGPRFVAMIEPSTVSRTVEVTFTQPGHAASIFSIEVPPAAMNVRTPTVNSAAHPPSCTSCTGSGAPSFDIAVPSDYALAARLMMRGSTDTIRCDSSDGTLTVPSSVLGATPSWAGISRFGLQLTRTRRETHDGIAWEGLQSISLGAPFAIRVP